MKQILVVLTILMMISCNKKKEECEYLSNRIQDLNTSEAKYIALGKESHVIQVKQTKKNVYTSMYRKDCIDKETLDIMIAYENEGL
jgi:hypothetical protein